MGEGPFVDESHCNAGKARQMPIKKQAVKYECAVWEIDFSPVFIRIDSYVGFIEGKKGNERREAVMRI